MSELTDKEILEATVVDQAIRLMRQEREIIVMEESACKNYEKIHHYETLLEQKNGIIETFQGEKK